MRRTPIAGSIGGRGKGGLLTGVGGRDDAIAVLTKSIGHGEAGAAMLRPIMTTAARVSTLRRWRRARD
jgi:hypothetical protein